MRYIYRKDLRIGSKVGLKGSSGMLAVWDLTGLAVSLSKLVECFERGKFQEHTQSAASGEPA